MPLEQEDRRRLSQDPIVVAVTAVSVAARMLERCDRQLPSKQDRPHAKPGVGDGAA